VFSTIDLFEPARLGSGGRAFAGRLTTVGAGHWLGDCAAGLLFSSGATLCCVSDFAPKAESARPTMATPPVEKTNARTMSDGASQRILVRIGGVQERLERHGPCAYVARAMRAREAPLERLEREIPACSDCPRLADFLASLRTRHPDYWNRPVPGFGDRNAWLAIIGLAPGLHGANRSGRPFFRDASGEWLYGELARRRLWDGERLAGVYIVNAVKCVPPGNRPTTDEQIRCQRWLGRELAALESARVVLALGRIAHGAVLRCWGVRPLAAHPFAHGRVARLPGRPVLVASYHPSRQNTNTGVLTSAMWRAVFARVARLERLRTTSRA